MTEYPVPNSEQSDVDSNIKVNKTAIYRANMDYAIAYSLKMDVDHWKQIKTD